MRDIKGYERLYAITSCGKVWSYRRQKFLRSRLNERGYVYVHLWKNGARKLAFVHRLVAEAYIPNLNSLETVDHKDNCKAHNYINNLQWMSRGDNSKKDKGTKVKCVETGEIFESCSAAARAYNRGPDCIRRAIIKNGTSAGYHWELV